MKDILLQLFGHRRLDRQTARDALTRISCGDCNESEMAAFMTVYLMRPVSVEELSGFRDALLDMCLPANLDGYDVMDMCGTGGDGKNTFNISTLAVFVAAGAGVKVAKHGNYGVSSASGSSNVMAHFGYRFHTDTSRLAAEIEQSGVCFLHAPLFHPALKNVAGVRKQLGVRTFFNMLGPLVNPARPKKQLTGVFSLELARLYGSRLDGDAADYSIVHSLDGYDEVSLTSAAKIIRSTGEDLLQPADFGMPVADPLELAGGASVEAAAAVFRSVLEGRGTAAQENAVVANAALALQCAGKAGSLGDAVAAARESLRSGKAKEKFQQLIRINSSLE